MLRIRGSGSQGRVKVECDPTVREGYKCDGERDGGSTECYK